tara:strand:- start:3964 stop:7146 length:3183 start_codon:yes stop_codon:yes gene_type:complete
MKINIWDPRNDKNIVTNYNSKTVKDIYKYYIEVLNREPRAILPRNVRYNKKTKKINILKANNPLIQNINYQQYSRDPVSQIYQIIKSYKGKKIRIKLTGFDGTVKTKTIAVSSMNDIWLQTNTKSGLWFWLRIDSEHGYLDEELNNDMGFGATRLSITQMPKIVGKNHSQKYADSVNHCVLGAIDHWVENKLENPDLKVKTVKDWKRKQNWLRTRAIKLDGGKGERPPKGAPRGFLEAYKDGIPVEKIQFICDKLQIAINIDIPSIWKSDYRRTVSVKSSNKIVNTFDFVNVRINHCEFNDPDKKLFDVYSLNSQTNKNNFEVSQEQINEIKRNLDKQDIFYTWFGNDDIGSIRSLQTINESYKCVNSYTIAIREFKEKYDIDQYQIDHLRDNCVSEFLIANVNINQTRNFSQEYDGECGHIDMIKAYTRSRESEYYEGFLGNIWEFRMTDRIREIGIYQIDNLDFSNCKNRIVSDMNIYHNKNSYPSPELKFLTDQWVKFDILCGCWGSSFDMDLYDKKLLDKDPGEIQHYKKFYGSLMGLYEHNTVNFRCEDVKFAEVVAHYNKDADINIISEEPKRYRIELIKIIQRQWKRKISKRFIYVRTAPGAELNSRTIQRAWKDHKNKKFIKFLENYNKGIVCPKKSTREWAHYQPRMIKQHGTITTQSTTQKHMFHIAGFINSYARLNLFRQLLKFKNPDDILRIKVDGIFYKKDAEFELDELYSEKEGSINFESDELDFIERDVWDHIDIETGELIDGIGLSQPLSQRVEVHTGPGGTGKSHNILIDWGLINMCFMAPTHKLKRSKEIEFKIQGEVHKGFDIVNSDGNQKRIRKINNYNGFIIDEISMLSNELKLIILKKYPNHKIIFCGDLGYQLPPLSICDEEPKSEFIIDDWMFHKSYSIEDMKRCKCPKLKKRLITLRKIIDKKKIGLDYIGILKLNLIDIDEVVRKYNYKEDLIIAQSNRVCDLWNEKFKDKPKYKIKQNTDEFSNGEIVCDLDLTINLTLKYEQRNCFTVYSIQGETAQGNLFIDLCKIHDPRCLYTALSRAEYFDNIYFMKSK